MDEMMLFQSYLFDINKADFIESRELYYDLLNLHKYSDCKISNLSKGYKARVSIMLALISEPQYLILDEPFDGIDENMQETLIGYFRKSNYGIIVSMHNKNIIKTLCDRIVEM